MFARQVLCTAEEGEVHALKGFRVNGLNEGHLVAHLVELAAHLVVVEQDNAGRSQRRLGEGFLQLPSQQGGGSGNGNLVHFRPFSA